MEDLWGFNSVDLAYEIAGSEIPVISAVGHESDFTICDFVADLRAPTPSAAAELAVPNLDDIRVEIDKCELSIRRALLMKLDNCRKYIDVLSKSRVLTSREALLNEYKMKISILSDEFDRLIRDTLKDKRTKLSLISAKLNAISPLATLSRGYAIAKNDSGDTVNSVSAIKRGDELSVVLSDGEILAEVKKIKEDQKLIQEES